jgi:hypothetical protein
MKYHTWIAVVKDMVVCKITCKNGVPNASWTSFRSSMAGSRQAMIFFMQISVTVGWWGILGMGGNTPKKGKFPPC